MDYEEFIYVQKNETANLNGRIKSMNDIAEKRLIKITEDLQKYQEEYNTRQLKFEEEYGED